MIPNSTPGVGFIVSLCGFSSESGLGSTSMINAWSDKTLGGIDESDTENNNRSDEIPWWLLELVCFDEIESGEWTYQTWPSEISLWVKL